MSDTHSPFTILAQTQCHLLRCVQSPTDTLLQEFTAAGLQEIRLDPAQLLAFVRCLPREVLLEAVGVNPFFGLDDAPGPCHRGGVEGRCPECLYAEYLDGLRRGAKAVGADSDVYADLAPPPSISGQVHRGPHNVDEGGA